MRTRPRQVGVPPDKRPRVATPALTRLRDCRAALAFDNRLFRTLMPIAPELVEDDEQ